MTGKQIGNWTVIKRDCNKKRTYWYCRCVCGVERSVREDSLKNSSSLGCGCRKVFNDYVVEDNVIKMKYKKYTFLFDAKHLDKVLKYSWGIEHYGYVVNYANNIRLHRLLTDCPRNMFVDHIDGNKLNNLDSNLRIVTNQQNSFNRDGYKKGNSSGHRGVYWDKKAKKWEASIKYNYKKKFLGYFDDKNEAIQARLDSEKLYFGKYNYNDSRGWLNE